MAQAASAQGFTKLSFQPNQNTAARGFSFRLEEPDNPAKPTLWQGPLSITHGATHCQVDASLVRDAYLSPAAKLLVVVSVSGSNTFVQFFHPANCTQAWPKLTAFSGGTEVKGNQLTLLPACECPAPGKPCSCSAGSVYQLTEDRPPHRLATESNTLNRRQFGQAFTGTRTIANPPSSLRP